MIVPKTFQLPSLLARVGWPLAAFFAWDIAVVVSYAWYHVGDVDLPVLPLSLLGTVLTLVLAFRANVSYGRWWEARTLWGALVNASRSFARQAIAFPGDERGNPAFKRQLVRRQIAYAHALRCALRRQDCLEEIAPFLPEAEPAALRGRNNIPDAILHGTATAIARARRAGVIDTIQQARLESTLVDLSNAQGGLERIKNTPLPRTYTVFTRFFVHLYCVLLPVGLVDSLGLYTPLVSAVVGFMLLVLDRIGDDMSNPFENTVHDVPMDAICRTIEIDLEQGIGTEDVPRPLQPVDDVLW